MSHSGVLGNPADLIKYWGLDPSAMGQFEENIRWIAATWQALHPLSLCQTRDCCQSSDVL